MVEASFRRYRYTRGHAESRQKAKSRAMAEISRGLKERPGISTKAICSHGPRKPAKKAKKSKKYKSVAARMARPIEYI